MFYTFKNLTQSFDILDPKMLNKRHGKYEIKNDIILVVSSNDY